jgi:hypothetical protein
VVGVGRRKGPRWIWVGKGGGCSGLRWAVALVGQKNEKKSRVADGLQGNTWRIEID